MKRSFTENAKLGIATQLAEQSWDDVLEAQDVDEKVAAMHNIIKDILDNLCPLKRVRVREDDPKWETQLTRKLRNCKNKAYKCGSRSYHYFAAALKRSIRKNRCQHVQNTINSVTDRSKNWWKACRKLTEGNRIQKDYHLLDGEWLDDQSLANKLNSYFANIGGARIGEQVLPTDFAMEPFRTYEGLVKSKLQKIDTTKSVFKQMKFPSLWKQAEVIPLNKVPNPTSAKDFRPISLLYHCSKIAEYFFMKEYKKQVLPKIGKNQFAYRRCLGTVDALVYSLEKWTHMLDQKDTAAVNVIFKDLSKAFNCMQPSILLQRLNAMNVTSNITKLI